MIVRSLVLASLVCAGTAHASILAWSHLVRSGTSATCANPPSTDTLSYLTTDNGAEFWAQLSRPQEANDLVTIQWLGPGLNHRDQYWFPNIPATCVWSKISIQSAQLVAGQYSVGVWLNGTQEAGLDFTITGPTTVQPPATPTNLTASIENADVKLGWTANDPSIGGFLLERNADNAGFIAYSNVAGNTRSFIDPSPGAHLECYRMRAVNSAGTSGYSNTACTLVLAPPILVSPADAITTTPGSFAFSWQGVTNADEYLFGLGTVCDSPSLGTQTVSGMITTATLPAGTVLWWVRAKNNLYNTVSPRSTCRSLIVQSQTTTLSGTVTDARSGGGIGAATVTWGNKSASTASNGAYSFSSISCQANTLIVTKSGYETYSSSVTPTCAAGSVKNVALTPIVAIANVSGTITAEGSGAPISGALVAFGVAQATSDLNGAYNLPGMPCSAATLAVAKGGYDSYTETYAPPVCPGSNLKNITLRVSANTVGGPFHIAMWIQIWPPALDSITSHGSALEEANPVWYEANEDGSIGTKPSQAGFEVYRSGFVSARIMPSLTSFNGASNAILRDSARTNTHINNILALISTHAYDGIDIDYEDVTSDLTDQYIHFLSALRDRLQSNKRLAVDVPAGAIQMWTRIGAVVDELKLMAYDYHYAGSTPGPVTPLPQLDATVAKAEQSGVPLSRIWICLPWYGYDWPTGATGRYIAADDPAAQGQVTYDDERIVHTATHTAYFQDSASFAAKLALLRQRHPNLRNIGVFAAGWERNDRATWDVADHVKT